MSSGTDSPGALIEAAMRRRGFSAYVLADLAGDVSPTTIRNYIRLKEPRRGYRLRSLYRVAKALGRDGPPILEAFGEQDAAGRLRATLDVDGTHKRPTVAYEGPLLTEEEAAAVRLFIRAVQHSRHESTAVVEPFVPTHPDSSDAASGSGNGTGNKTGSRKRRSLAGAL